MIERKKYPRAEALAVAEELQAMIAPACKRIAIAGSLRRLKPEVGDIELVYSPIFTERPDGLFDQKIVSVAEEVIEWMLERPLRPAYSKGQIKGPMLEKRPNIIGQFTWGESNKLAIHVASGIPVDLFSTSEERWYTSLVIRTGSKETNLRLTMGAQKQNARLLAYGPGVKWSDGTVTKATSEQHLFEMCGVPYLEPSER